MTSVDTHALFKTLRVMVVDDLPSARRVIRRMLGRLGCESVVEAPDGRAALAMLSEDPNPVGLVICDNSMKDMGGVELVKAMKGDPLLRSVPFVMLSSYNEQQKVQEAAHAGALLYLQKPLNIQMLGEKLATVLEGQRMLRDLEEGLGDD